MATTTTQENVLPQEKAKLPGGVLQLPINTLDMELPCTLSFSSTRGGDCRARRALFQGTQVTAALGKIHPLRQEVSVEIGETKPSSFDVVTIAQFVNQYGATMSNAELTFHSGHGRGVMRILHKEKYINLYSVRLPESYEITWSADCDDRFYVHLVSWGDWGLMKRLQNAHNEGFVDMYDVTTLQKWIAETGLTPAVNFQISVNQWSPKTLLVSDQPSPVVYQAVPDGFSPPVSRPSSPPSSDNQSTPPDTWRIRKRRYTSMEPHLNL